MKKNNLIRLLVAVSTASVFLLMFVFTTMTATIRPSAKEIPAKSLIIGTYIIYLDSLTNPVYNIAIESGKSSGQYNIYYKSELSGGNQWYDISTAVSLSDIDDGGIKVDDATIDALVLTHWVKEDRKTYDLETGEVVDLLDSQDVWNPISMSELTDVVNIYENGSDIEKKLAQYIMPSLDIRKAEEGQPTHIPVAVITEPEERYDVSDDFFVENEIIDDFEKQRKAMSDFYNYLVSRNTEEQKLILAEELKNDVLIDMKLVAYQKVSDRIPFLSSKLAEYAPENDVSNFTSIVTQITNDITQTIATLPSQKSESADVTNMLTQFMSDAKDKIVENASVNNFSAAEEALNEYYYLRAINQSEIKNAETELTLDRQVIDAAFSEFYTILQKGESDEYHQAESEGYYEASLSDVRQEDYQELKSKESHIEFLIDAEMERCEDENEENELINSRLQEALSYMNSIPNDSYYDLYYDVYETLLYYLGYSLSSSTDDVQEQPMDDVISMPSGPNGEEVNVPVITVTTPDGEEIQLPAEPVINPDGSQKTDENGEPLYKPTEKGDPIKDENGNNVKDENGNDVLAEGVPETDLDYNDLQKDKSDAKKKIDDALASGNIDEALEGFKELSEAQSNIDKAAETVDNVTLEASQGMDAIVDSIRDSAKSPVEASDLASIQNQVNTLAGIAPMVPDQAMAAAEEIKDILEKAAKENPFIAESLTEAIEAAGEIADGNFDAVLTDLEDEIVLPWNESAIPDSLYTVMEFADIQLKNTRTKTLVKALILISAAETGYYAQEEVQAVTKDLIQYSYKYPAYGTFAMPISNRGTHYYPADIMCESIGMRYLWEESRSDATILNGSEFDRYFENSNKYIKNGKETVSLDFTVPFRSEVCYFTQKHMEEAYGAYRKFLPNSGYCVIYNDSILKEAEDIVTAVIGQ